MNINWLKHRKNLRGRDPLGVQAINIHLYSTLVPGITNVTDRLRYYSFYLWILKLYREGNAKLDFVPFLRRSEFLFSVITNFHHRDETYWSGHMVGTMVMGQVFSALNENKKIILSKYTSLEESSQRYFKNKLGGFGQYYLGVLAAMGILSRKENLEFVLYPFGIELANAFHAGDTKDRFISCVLTDKVTIKDLELLQENLCACNLKQNSTEYKLLAGALKGSDDPYVKEPTHRRRDSLALLFLLLKQIGETADYWKLLNFLFYGISKDNKKANIPDNLTETANLWKYYVIHEYFSIALLAIFVSTQYILDEKALSRHEIGQALWDRYALNCDTNSLQKSLVKSIGKLKKNPNLYDFLEYLESSYESAKVWGVDSLSEISISNFLFEKQPPEALFVGGLVLLCLALRAIKKESEHQDAYLMNFFNQYPINLSKMRNDYAERWQKMKMSEVINDLAINYVINRHIEVAIRKLYTEGLATFRILREDNTYRHSEIEIDYVSSTSPRLRESLQMMSDLKIVDETRNGFAISNENIGLTYFGDLISGN